MLTPFIQHIALTLWYGLPVPLITHICIEHVVTTIDNAVTICVEENWLCVKYAFSIYGLGAMGCPAFH